MAETSTPIPFELKKGPRASLDNTNLKLGTIYVCTDSSEVFADLEENGEVKRKKLLNTKIAVDEESGTLNITF